MKPGDLVSVKESCRAQYEDVFYAKGYDPDESAMLLETLFVEELGPGRAYCYVGGVPRLGFWVATSHLVPKVVGAPTSTKAGRLEPTKATPLEEQRGASVRSVANVARWLRSRRLRLTLTFKKGHFTAKAGRHVVTGPDLEQVVGDLFDRFWSEDSV